MQYVKSAQFVPGKGDAWTYYEVDDDGTVLRQMTHIPETDELSQVHGPSRKKLLRPELCQETTPEEFAELWNRE